ncbi:MAG: NADH-quinone oxidoreductase subunit C [Bacteroidales bacterium]
MERRYIEILTNPGTVRLTDIPVLEYPEFAEFVDLLMGEEGTHCVSYFVLPQTNSYQFICCMAADENHAVLVFSHEQTREPALSLPSLSARHFQFHKFEREIHENFGIGFQNHPWLKPVRYPYGRADQTKVMDNYPFYAIDGDELHEVGVGPIHAGIIEPGHFRFICHGEQVLHLEIQLGYQHRGVEKLFVEKPGILQQSILAECIAGDTAVGHSMAYCSVAESLAGVKISSRLAKERIVALELERIAVHIGDTAALCTDIAYQFGQVVNEALRTIVINTTQLWCGNRFGKGLLRPGGSNYPLHDVMITEILKNLREVEERYLQVTSRIFSLPSVLSRFEGTGKVTTMQASLIGAVGMAAKSSGMYRDIRWSHPFLAYNDYSYEPVMLHKGDVWSRAMVRKLEVEKSMTVIRDLLEELRTGIEAGQEENSAPGYDLKFAPESLAISLVEGWRGEICHIAVTDEEGRMVHYKVKDPSFHNWMALAIAVRNQEISDFPLCNKSFNLSYCGNDL